MTTSKVLSGMGKLGIVFSGPNSLEDELPCTTSVQCTTDEENDKEEDASSEPPLKGLLATWMERIGVLSDRLVVHGLNLHSEVSAHTSLTVFNFMTMIIYYLVYFDGTENEKKAGSLKKNIIIPTVKELDVLKGNQ
ncbi:hypothetical protein DER45DRAFT_630430 [Fusarium avenaceum]|nr:hypothetical protein DER45DRAFT_630430 [Fusarium avenaceum]